MEKTIYLDHAATTPVELDVTAVMRPFLFENYGNPSSDYELGKISARAIENARNKIAKAMNAKPDQIYFTSCGTEADNWALIGIAEMMSNQGRGNHIITTKIEHHAILNTCKYLEERGFEVTYLDVDSRGLVSVEDVENAITDKTILISIMMVNNEIGTVEPIKSIGAVAKKHGIPFHVDAVQAFGHIPIDVRDMNICLMSTSAHKLGAVKGTGCLYYNEYFVPGLKPFIHGGHQENSMRAGTENVAGIVGFGKAAEISEKYMADQTEHIAILRDWLGNELLKIDGSHINGVDYHKNYDLRCPNNLSIRFDGVNSTLLQSMLAEKGICTSVGSACNSGIPTPSHVLKAIGLSDDEAHETLRISLGHENTIDEMEEVVKWINIFVRMLRN